MWLLITGIHYSSVTVPNGCAQGIKERDQSFETALDSIKIAYEKKLQEISTTDSIR
jgi:hypothetical protein